MSVVKLKYEILVSGIYPMENDFSRNGFTLTKHTLEEEKLNYVCDAGLIYLSPYIGYCSYPDGAGNMVYQTFEKKVTVDIDYSTTKEYDRKYTLQELERLDLFSQVDDLEKMMVLVVNNDIKFPIKMVKAYSNAGTFITMMSNFINPNVPSLISKDKADALERITRQTHRLNSGFSEEKITELRENNEFFENALSMYYSSFSVNDAMVSFVLLVTALEALLSKSTYSEIENCASCNQPMYKIRASMGDNVSQILMDQDDSIKSRIKKLYDKRSKFLHAGKREISKQDTVEMQEYVRKVLLMYWCVSLKKSTFDHKLIMEEILSDQYKNDVMYRSFLTCLGNSSFENKKLSLLKDILVEITTKRAELVGGRAATGSSTEIRIANE